MSPSVQADLGGGMASPQRGGGEAPSPRLRQLSRSFRQAAGAGERLFWVGEAVEWVGSWPRSLLGLLWPGFHRVALLATDRRLLEVGLGFFAGAKLRRIRSFSAPSDLALGSAGRRLTLHREPPVQWRLRQPMPADVGTRLQTQSGDRSSSRPGQIAELCPNCWRELVAGDCVACGARQRLRGVSGLLALAFSGAGLLYSGHPVFAALRGLLEVVVSAAYAYLWLQSDSYPVRIAYLLVLPPLLVLFKLESFSTARYLAERSAPGLRLEHRRWRLALGVAAIASLAILVVPPIFVGAMEQHADRALNIANASREWQPVVPSPGCEEEESPECGENRTLTGNEWIHRDGWQVSASVSPLEPWESLEGAALRLQDSLLPSPDAIDLQQMGHHQVLRIRQSLGADRLALEFMVFDQPQRDLHGIRLETSASRMAEAEAVLAALVRRTYFGRLKDEG